MTDKVDLNLDELQFNDRGLIPAIAQDYYTGEVRMLAYMNRKALRKTVETGLVHYYSRSREELWQKGETSGHRQHLKALRRDCDRDTLLVFVEQEGVACHTGQRNCFFEQLEESSGDWDQVDPRPPGSLGAILGELRKVVEERDQERPADSYTTKLLTGEADKEALDLILEKIGEESNELLLAAKNQSEKRLQEEISDLLYHLLVLCQKTDVELETVAEELAARRG